MRSRWRVEANRLSVALGIYQIQEGKTAPTLEALAPLMAAEVGQVDAYRVLTAAIGAGDPETARAAADRVLRPTTESLLGALAVLEAEITEARG